MEQRSRGYTSHNRKNKVQRPDVYLDSHKETAPDPESASQWQWQFFMLLRFYVRVILSLAWAHNNIFSLFSIYVLHVEKQPFVEVFFCARYHL